MMLRGMACLMFAVAALAAKDAAAVDLSRVPDAVGVACDSPAATAFESVWLGHFTGGFSRHLGPGLPVVLDWRDETLCFPTRRGCERHIGVMRRDFHRPEGYFTCLPIR
jgi:hypothetical protein